MNKQFEPLFTPYDAWLWAHPPVYAIANVSWCDPRQDHRFYSFKMQQEHPFRVPPVVSRRKTRPFIGPDNRTGTPPSWGSTSQVASLRGMDAVEHIELVIFLRNLIHLGIIPQVDDPDLILFLQLQQLLHHLAVGGAVVLGARIEHHRAMPCGVGIYDDVFERAKDGFGVKVLQIAGTADFPQRDRVACIVGGKLADERIKLCVGVDIVQHPLDVGGLVVVGQCGAADSLFDIGAVVANGNVLRKGGSSEAAPRSPRPQKHRFIPLNGLFSTGATFSGR